MIGHHSRLGDAMSLSYPIHACTRANYGRYIDRSKSHFAIPQNKVYKSNTWKKT